MAEFQWQNLGANVDGIISALTGTKPATEGAAAAKAVAPISGGLILAGFAILLFVLLKK